MRLEEVAGEEKDTKGANGTKTAKQPKKKATARKA
jgi:hypothetical protein